MYERLKPIASAVGGRWHMQMSAVLTWMSMQCDCCFLDGEPFLVSRNSGS